MVNNELLKREAEAFDTQIEERIKYGFIPDLRRLKTVELFYNNEWREPEFIEIHLMPKINFVLDIAKKSGGRALEIGCGSGYLSLELARNNLHVLGIDISSKNIEIAKKYGLENPFKENFGSLRYEVGNITERDLEESSFNSIVFFRTLHHFEYIE